MTADKVSAESYYMILSPFLRKRISTSLCLKFMLVKVAEKLLTHIALAHIE